VLDLTHFLTHIWHNKEMKNFLFSLYLIPSFCFAIDGLNLKCTEGNLITSVFSFNTSTVQKSKNAFKDGIGESTMSGATYKTPNINSIKVSFSRTKIQTNEYVDWCGGCYLRIDRLSGKAFDFKTQSLSDYMARTGKKTFSYDGEVPKVPLWVREDYGSCEKISNSEAKSIIAKLRKTKKEPDTKF
tara:strand:- start:861 stop:1418 length:558 start_codon:yes stop_codon:yes gene_type:complete